ncbi:hypothetical protein ACJX0J_038041, partial [Zea mays]
KKLFRRSWAKYKITNVEYHNIHLAVITHRIKTIWRHNFQKILQSLMAVTRSLNWESGVALQTMSGIQVLKVFEMA